MAHNFKYTPEYTTKKNNIFLEEFYTGVDTTVSIDNVDADFIASISYNIQESINPLYGYNSYTFDDVAVGNRIVVGTILIPVMNYDTYLVDFTKTDKDKKHPVIQESQAYMPGKAWHTKPYWATVWKPPSVEVQPPNVGDDSKPPIEPDTPSGGGGGGSNNQEALSLTRTRRIMSRRDPGPGDDGDDILYPLPDPTPDTRTGTHDPSTGELIVLDPIKDKYNRKPTFKRGTTPYFNESWSVHSSTLNFIKCRLKDNYKDICIKLAGRPSILLKTVVFKSSSTTYSANDEPVYESIEFIARDIIHLD